MKKKSLLVSSLMTMMLCGSLIAGATYSLFTSESTHNITVSSGTVNVQSTLLENTIKLSSLDGEQTGRTFSNGGTIEVLEGKNLILNKMTPGDKVTFDINIKNLSTVATKYRVVIKCKDGFKLFGALRIVYEAQTDFKYWAPVIGDNPGVTTTCLIELPNETGNEYQGLSTSLVISVEAIQNNAPLPNVIDNSFGTDEGTAPIDQSVETATEPLMVYSNKGLATVKIPANRVDTTKSEAKLTVKNTTDPGNFVIDGDPHITYYDISLEGTKTSKIYFDVDLFIGKNLYLPHVYHVDTKGKTTQIDTEYNADTGFIHFRTPSFSPFAVTAYKKKMFTAETTPELTAKSLQSAINDYQNVTLESDITLNSTPSALFEINKDTVINLNGHSITFNILDNATNDTSLFKINKNGFLKVELNFTGKEGEGKIEAISSNANAKTSLFYLNDPSSNLRINNKIGDYLGAPHVVKCASGTANVHNGTFGLSSSYKAVAPETSNELFVRVNPQSSETSNIILGDGKYINFKPYNINNNGETNYHFVEPGKTVYSELNASSDTVYNIVASNTFSSNFSREGGYSLPSDIFATYAENRVKVGGTLLKPIYAYNYNAFVLSSGNNKINLNGHNIIFDEAKYDSTYSNYVDQVVCGIYLNGSAKLDIVGDGTVSSVDSNKFTSIYTIDLRDKTNILNIESGTFIGLDTAIQVEDGTANIKGGTFKASAPDASTSRYILNCLDKKLDNNGQIIGGYIKGTAKINMTGGKIVGFDPMNNPEGAVAPEGAAAGVVYGANAYVPVTHETREVVGESGTYEVILKQQSAQ